MKQQLRLLPKEYSKVDLPIIIPAYQPEQRMLELLERLSDEKLFGALIVVDEGSSPGTAELFTAAE